ncbi:hypothetical protein IAF57_13625, partial [Acinetobacter baumannii]|nr:hypothetical protein [Acinetobacter baumannii]
DILATSTYLRYLELLGQNLVFPKNAYQGDYVKEIAQGIIDKDSKPDIELRKNRFKKMKKVSN